MCSVEMKSPNSAEQQQENSAMIPLDPETTATWLQTGPCTNAGCNPWKSGFMSLPHRFYLFGQGMTHLWLYFPGLSLATPFNQIYSGLWGYNSSLSCAAIGGMFLALTWQSHLLAMACGRYPEGFHLPLKWDSVPFAAEVGWSQMGTSRQADGCRWGWRVVELGVGTTPVLSFLAKSCV